MQGVSLLDHLFFSSYKHRLLSFPLPKLPYLSFPLISWFSFLFLFFCCCNPMMEIFQKENCWCQRVSMQPIYFNLFVCTLQNHSSKHQPVQRSLRRNTRIQTATLWSPKNRTKVDLQTKENILHLTIEIYKTNNFHSFFFFIHFFSGKGAIDNLSSAHSQLQNALLGYPKP